MCDNKWCDEKGLTLVEVLAAVVILSLIFVSIVNMLNQSARANKTSEEIIDATYITQREMETIYKLSKEGKHLDAITDYMKQPNEANWEVYHKNVNDQLLLEIKQDDSDKPMVRIVVTAYEVEDLAKTNPKAKMETLLKWEEADETSTE